jgi:DMSO/TMAO reductase YedYZ molybdopterin-dependent catalytic subunit
MKIGMIGTSSRQSKLSWQVIVVILFGVAALGCTATPAPSTATQALAQAPTSPPKTATPAAPVALKVDGPGGSRSLTLADIRALPAVEGWAGIKSSTGRITIPERFKGVPLTELAKLAGGLAPESGANIVAKDGYAMTMSYDQITKGDFIAYDPATGDELKSKDALTVILAYEMAGKPLDETTDGTLRLMVVSAKNNQVVDGHWSVKWITQLSVKTLSQDWKLQLIGMISEEMDRGTFQSCSAASCHGKTWTDEKAQVWTGVPLWLIAGRVDDEIKHGDNSYNLKAVDEGYTLEMVAADGYKVAVDAARSKRNDNILVAYMVNNNPLDDKYFPLRLVGADLKSSELVGKITRINLVTPAKSTSSPSPTAAAKPTETPKPASALPTAPAGGAALTITGAVDKELSLTLDALKAMPVLKLKAEHPKKGPQDYEGVRFAALLDLAKPKSGATKVILTSGDAYVTELTLSELRACADCLLAFNAGKLDGAMPGMQSNFWAKDVVKMELR